MSAASAPADAAASGKGYGAVVMWAQPTLQQLRAWAYEPDAQDAPETHGPLDDPDADLLLHDWKYVPALIEAAADPHCPNGEYCARILTDFAMHLVRCHRRDDFDRLCAAARQCRGRFRVHEWAAHIDRMLAYATWHGQVNRATAQQMAVDLLVRPGWYATWDEPTRSRNLTVQITDPATHWLATWHDAYPQHLYVNRRNGAYRWTRNPLLPARIRQIR